MAKKLYAVNVKGNQHEWPFRFYGDPASLQEWRDDGLEIYDLQNSIPEWIASAGLTKLWCFFQDLFNFKNPFA